MKYSEVEFDESEGYPVGKELSYQCTLCGDILSSFDVRSASFCQCRNLHVDADYCRISIKTLNSVKLLKKVEDEK